MFTDFSTGNLHLINALFDRFGNHDEHLRLSFIRCYKFIIKICENNLPITFIDFLNISIKIFQISPLANYHIISIFSMLLDVLT